MSEVNAGQLEAIEIELDVAKGFVKQFDAMMNLVKNPDWQLLVETGYFKEEASRLCLLKGDSVAEDPIVMKGIEDSITGIGQFYQYLRAVQHQGRAAMAAMGEKEETRDEILEEG